jgi:hypothetical protein
MCFSAQADLVAGVVVGGIAVDAMRHVRQPAHKVLVAIPVVLATHQLIETFVWWGLEGDVPHSVWHPALWLYLVIAFGVVPVLVPLAVAALEPAVNRWRMGVFVAIGCGVAIVLINAVVRGPVEASIEGHHISYRVSLWHGGFIVGSYALATCGSLLFSKHSYVRRFGASNLVVVGLLAWLNNDGLISLWCVWAAITSIAVTVHLRHTAEPPRPRVVTAHP